jgi:hypothetical protein
MRQFYRPTGLGSAEVGIDVAGPLGEERIPPVVASYSGSAVLRVGASDQGTHTVRMVSAVEAVNALHTFMATYPDAASELDFHYGERALCREAQVAFDLSVSGVEVVVPLGEPAVQG